MKCNICNKHCCVCGAAEFVPKKNKPKKEKPVPIIEALINKASELKYGDTMFVTKEEYTHLIRIDYVALENGKTWFLGKKIEVKE